MSRHRFCTTNDRDGFIEELAQEIWEDRRQSEDGGGWAEAGEEEQRKYRKLAAETLRVLEHGHG
jgi:hypothetical protein